MSGLAAITLVMCELKSVVPSLGQPSETFSACGISFLNVTVQ
jgi:hypothetical protein